MNAAQIFCRPAIAILVQAICWVNASAQTAQASTTRYEYDAGGNLTLIVDPRGKATNMEYDNLDRVKLQILPAPSANAARPTIGIGYDGQDQITKVTDPRNLATAYGIDGLGNENALTSPDTGAASRVFDARGNLKSIKDARGKLASFTYDALERVTRIDYGTDRATTFEYDTGSLGAIGRLSRMTDGSGETSYRYDEVGRLVKRVQSILSISGTPKQFALTFGYGLHDGARGKITSVTYPSGNRIITEFDGAGRVSSLSLIPAGGTTPVRLLGNIRYQPFGQASAWEWGTSLPGKQNLYVRRFDQQGKMTGYPLGDVRDGAAYRELVYDATGRIIAAKHTNNGMLPVAPASRLDQYYQYDDQDRLTGFSAQGTTQSYRYDANGNRTQVTFGSNVYANTIDSMSNRLTSTTGPLPRKTNAYDAAGNLISDGTTAFTYGVGGAHAVSARGWRHDYVFVQRPWPARPQGR